MEKVEFRDDDGSTVDFYVIDETRINGVNYILVSETDDEDEDTDVYIMKDVSESSDAEAVYEFVENDDELEAVGKVFGELMEDDTELKQS